MIETDDRKNVDRWNQLQSAVHELRICATFRLMRDNGIEPILLKGWGAARAYPALEPRAYNDLDLAVAPEHFERAFGLVRSGASLGLNIDLHCGFRHYDTRPWLEIFDRSELFELDGVPIRIPSLEDHLRILAAHWLNDGGVRKDRLWDIYYSVVNRPDSFDWDYCLNAAGPERRSWVVCAIAIAHRYISLPVDDIPISDEELEIPEWIRMTIESEWASGTGLIDLQACLGDRKLFIEQLRKRIPPNPIQATIEMQKSLGGKRRRYYQLITMLRRAVPSLGKFKSTFKSRMSQS